MPVDPVANAARPRRRKDFSDKPAQPTGFDPANSCLNEAMARPSGTRSIHTDEEA